jgi:hypothetical protein
MGAVDVGSLRTVAPMMFPAPVPGVLVPAMVIPIGLFSALWVSDAPVAATVCPVVTRTPPTVLPNAPVGPVAIVLPPDAMPVPVPSTIPPPVLPTVPVNVVPVVPLFVAPVLATVPVAALPVVPLPLLALAAPDAGELAELPQAVSISGNTQAMATVLDHRYFALDMSEPSADVAGPRGSRASKCTPS